MARKKDDNVEYEEVIEETPQLTQGEMEMLQDEQEDDLEDEKEESAEEQMELSKEMQELYGSPQPEESHSAHTILNKAMFEMPDTIKTTFLTESELGRPLFSVRFLLDLFRAADHSDLKRICGYYWNKVQNITGSGLSNRGFGLNITVTHRKDTTRRRVRELHKVEDEKKI